MKRYTKTDLLRFANRVRDKPLFGSCKSEYYFVVQILRRKGIHVYKGGTRGFRKYYLEKGWKEKIEAMP